jgi:hypothetical protein
MRRVYFSHSDSTEDHYSSQYGDDHIPGKIIRPIRLSHLIAFNIKENEDEISGILTIEFEYYSADGSIKYRDMHYSDPRV